METDLESESSVGLLPIDEELALEDNGATMISNGTSQSGNFFFLKLLLINGSDMGRKWVETLNGLY